MDDKTNGNTLNLPEYLRGVPDSFRNDEKIFQDKIGTLDINDVYNKNWIVKLESAKTELTIEIDPEDTDRKVYLKLNFRYMPVKTGVGESLKIIAHFKGEPVNTTLVSINNPQVNTIDNFLNGWYQISTDDKGNGVIPVLLKL